MDISGFAFWGLLGSFVYGAPRLLVALSEAQAIRDVVYAIAEFAIALAIGTIGAAACTPIVVEVWGWKGAANMRAGSFVIGMVANPIAPAVVHLVSDNFLRHLSAPLAPLKPRNKR